MTPQEVQDRFIELCNTPSDINEHLPILREYADKCDHVTEMGVRGCVSLFAFLSSKSSKVVAVDIFDVWTPNVEKLQFFCADDLQIEIDRTDMLFIDTRHCYEQLIQELNLHAKNVKKYIGLHDVEIFGEWGDDGGKGLMYAVWEFLAKNNNDWRICYHVKYNHGLLIMERI